MKTSIVGLIYTGEKTERLRELTSRRSLAALPLLGRYRLIDFLLSNMVNSGVQNVGVMMQSNYQSLLDQLGSGREWDLHGKRSGMMLLPPFATTDSDNSYTGLLDALKSNMNFLRRNTERYIATTESGFLYSLRYEELLDFHLKNEADITLVYTKDRDARRNGIGRYLGVDENNQINHIEVDPAIPRYENTYIGVFLMRRELLINLVDMATSQGFHHFMREMLIKILAEGQLKLVGYELPTKPFNIDSVEAYYNTNMALLSQENRKDLFDLRRPVWTKLRDEMPSQYSKDAKVSNSLVADGCVIEGEVEDSILFRGVRVQPGTKIKGCIIMQDSLIEKGAQIENCILDKQTTVRENSKLTATPGYPFVVPKNLTI
ncbi:MAG: glucose-1-phosphate adenylyltransferase subunit GlgD [Eubacteriales bacterium]|nr:glucose-1-phosphate adenylyltransferase subunit GlgD [Eubacteriales bacterium]